MRAYQDRETGLWKWGSNGKPIYKTKRECNTDGLKQLTDKLRKIKDRLGKAIHSHGL